MITKLKDAGVTTIIYTGDPLTPGVHHQGSDGAELLPRVDHRPDGARRHRDLRPHLRPGAVGSTRSASRSCPGGRRSRRTSRASSTSGSTASPPPNNTYGVINPSVLRCSDRHPARGAEAHAADASGTGFSATRRPAADRSARSMSLGQARPLAGDRLLRLRRRRPSSGGTPSASGRGRGRQGRERPVPATPTAASATRRGKFPPQGPGRACSTPRRR